MADRRNFLKTTTSIALTAPIAACQPLSKEGKEIYKPSERLARFQDIQRAPVLDRNLFKEAIIIDSIELFKAGKHYFVQVRSKDGALGIAVMNKKYVLNIYPIILNRIIKFFAKKDARDLEELIENAYLGDLNYKWQGLAFWVGVAYIELAILDLLGNSAGLPVGTILGGRVREKVSIYYASGNRGNKAEEEIDHLLELVEKSGAKALKYRLGARMNYDRKSTKRDQELIPLVRKTLGENATIYADANGSYDVNMGIKIGRILEEYQTDFFEEPCRFDHYEETKAVADALDIPIAGGEEEVSTRQFMWLMDKGVYAVVQPDLLFYGGLTRSIKIARMADAIGISCTPHISGSALGFLYMMQFASCVPNIGPYQEFKGNKDKVPVSSDSSSLQPKNGIITIPKEPGLGVMYDPGFLSKGKKIETI